MHTLTSRIYCVVAATVLAGCAAPPPPKPMPATVATQPAPVPRPVVPAAPTAPPVPAAPVVIEPSASEKALASALASFDRGDYPGAIRQLTPLSTDSALDTASQLRTLKTLAFAQCLTRAITPCRQTFERAFRLDGKFDLAPAERGHPVWGPQFDRARKTVNG